MPNHIKIIISLIALAMCTLVFWFDHQSGDAAFETSKWVALCLGPLMVGSIWVFPEAKKRDVGDIRKANSANR